MLEEYLCLGGNEVVNNARVYGYASTANCPLSWFRCAPCPTLHAAINDWIPSENRWIEQRRNVWTNPRAVTGGTAFGTMTNGTATIGNVYPGTGGTATSYRWTVTTASSASRIAVMGTGLDTPDNSESAHIMFRVFVTGGNIVSPQLAIRPNNVTGTTGQTLITLNGGASLTPGEYVFDLSSVVTATAVTASGGIVFLGTASVVGMTVDVTDILVESQTTGTFFDGQTPDQQADPGKVMPGDVNFAWVGTPNASASIQSQYTTVNAGHSAELPYEYGNISLAPWYDEDRAALTSRFYGVYGIEFANVDDSTRTATVTEAILDGGVVGLVRHASREVTVRALLTAQGLDALEYGMSWLDAVLSSDGCSSHGANCGAVDMTFFSACPDPETPDEIVLAAEEQIRYLHNVTVTSGPLILDRFHSNDDIHYGYIVEWTMVAGTPFVFGATAEVPIQPSIPTVIQDIPYNLVPVPSAELASGNVTIATNYSDNPSLEVNATNWSTVGAVVSGTDPTTFMTGVRDTTIHAGDGVASYRVRLLGNNGTTVVTNAVSDIRGMNTVTLAPATGQRYSVTVWGAVFIIAGAAGSALTNIFGEIVWRNGTTVLRTDSLGTSTTTFNGLIFSQKSIVPPATTTNALVRVGARVTWSSSATAANNSDIQLFVDTVAVTTP